jgi:flavorubredoxin
MGRPFEAVKITDRVYWVGAIDWAVRDFHGYSTDRGTTYNAYVVLADKIALIDTVKAPFRDELLSRVASIVDPREIEVVVSNHSEMDHSGCLPEIVDAVRPSEIYASQMGARALESHFHGAVSVTGVKDGETRSLGNVALSFVETRMLHWPDSMFSYLAGEEVLFSQDAFGMHLASEERFGDEIPDDVLNHEAAKYYANILLPFSPLVSKLLARVRELDLRPALVAPDHGPLWRGEGIGKIVDAYGAWAAQEPTEKTVIVYDTMWQSTAKMARAIADGVSAGGAKARVLPLRASHRSEVAAEILEAGALLVGTPTMNNHMFPTVADTLTYLKGLRPSNMIGGAFGSYGWSGEGVAQATDVLAAMNIDLVTDGLKVRYVPDEDALMACRELGERVAGRLLPAPVT